MLNHLKCGVAAAVLCSSLNIAQAEEFMHGFNFTSVPTFAELSTASCETPQQFVYTVTNTGHKPVQLVMIKFEKDDTSDDADVSFDQTGSSTCLADTHMPTLETGESCTVALNIQACNEGTIIGALTVKGEGVGHIPYPKVATAAINATVSSEM